MLIHALHILFLILHLIMQPQNATWGWIADQKDASLKDAQHRLGP